MAKKKKKGNYIPHKNLVPGEWYKEEYMGWTFRCHSKTKGAQVFYDRVIKDGIRTSSSKDWFSNGSMTGTISRQEDLSEAKKLFPKDFKNIIPSYSIY